MRLSLRAVSLRAVRAAVALGVAITGTVAVIGTTPADAATCYSWSRTLRPGARGSDVAHLQIRVAGWAGTGNVVVVDGIYGEQTRRAVAAFQRAYGLTVHGVAGQQTFNQIYALTDPDCTPAHFAWSEFDSTDGAGFSGGKVSETLVRRNVFRTMWKLEALRRKLGDHPIIVASGFRSVRRNSQVGGESNSQHMYGTAADLAATRDNRLCKLAQGARSSGFSGIIGPNAPGHNDHVHLDSRQENGQDGIPNGRYWNAPRCF